MSATKPYIDYHSTDGIPAEFSLHGLSYRDICALQQLLAAARRLNTKRNFGYPVIESLSNIRDALSAKFDFEKDLHPDGLPITAEDRQQLQKVLEDHYHNVRILTEGGHRV